MRIYRRERIGAVASWLTEVKLHLQIDTSDHDDLLLILLSSAIDTVEQYCAVSLFETKLIVQWDSVIGKEELPYGPVRSVEENGGASAYGYMPGFVAISSEESVEVEYTAGYSEIPEVFKLAVMKLVTDNFEQRAGFNMSGRLMVADFPNDWRNTLKPYRRISFIS